MGNDRHLCFLGPAIDSDRGDQMSCSLTVLLGSRRVKFDAIAGLFLKMTLGWHLAR